MGQADCVCPRDSEKRERENLAARVEGRREEGGGQSEAMIETVSGLEFVFMPAHQTVVEME